MEQDFNIEHWQDKKCPPVNCRKKTCECGLEKVFLSSALGDDSKDSPIAPKNGAYCNAIVVYEANSHVYIYSKEGIPTLVETGGDVEEIIEQLENQLAQEILDRQAADNVLQGEIDDLKNSPDVVDIVQDYAALQAYDTSKLGDNDIIRVLQDETHDDNSTYYRWDKQTETWTYIGSIQMTANTIFYADLSETGNTRHIYKNSDMTGTVSVQELLDANEDGQVILRMSSAQTPENFNDAYLQNTYVGVSDYQFLFLDNRNYYEYDATTTADTTYYYSKSTIQLELTAGNNITITGNTISATDTTYSNFAGTDGQTAGTAGLVPAPATTDAGKFLKADGTWGTVIDDTVYSDKTTSDSAKGGAVYIGNLNSNQEEQPDPTTADYHNKYFWALPYSNSSIPGRDSINILGDGATFRSVVIGYGANNVSSAEGIAIGPTATLNNAPDGVAIGHSAYIGAGLTSSVALGYKAMPTRSGEVNIGNYASEGFNSSQYRVLGGVYDAQDGHDAVNLSQLNGRILQNAGAPTTSTVGTVGQLLEDTTNGKLYQCTAIDTTDPDNPSYTWDEVGGGGGGGDTVYSTKTTSNQSDGGAVFIGPLNSSQQELADPTTTDNHYRYFWALPFDVGGLDQFGTPSDESINIGGKNTGARSVSLGYRNTAVDSKSVVVGWQSASNGFGSNVVIGDTAKSLNSNSIAIGKSAQTGANGSTAIGAYAETTRVGEINVGSTSSSYGYNHTNYRVIGGVHDGQDAHDAATVAQGNTLATAAPDTSTVGVLGQLWTDTTNMHTYQCTAISGSTYTWQMRW